MELSYGTFNNYNIQAIHPYESFFFEKNNNLVDITHQEKTSNIIILKDGYYIINVILHLEDTGTVAFYKNDEIIKKTISTSNIGTNIVFVHELIFLKQLDVITLRNYSENKIILHNKHNKMNLDLIISKV